MEIDRLDGRTPNQLRPLACSRNVLNRAHGSASWCQGFYFITPCITLGIVLCILVCLLQWVGVLLDYVDTALLYLFKCLIGF